MARTLVKPAHVKASALFRATFGVAPRAAASAPGRVNLIGEHTDYNEGFVLPMAIEPEIRLVCRSREDATVRLTSTAYG